MKRNSVDGISSVLTTCVTGFGILFAGTGIAGEGGGKILTTTNIPMPRIDSSQIEIDMSDYEAECGEGKPKSYSGNLSLTSLIELEDHRCIKIVYGNLNLDTNNSTLGFILPWLARVTGDLQLEGNGSLPFARLPRLTRVDGEIVVDAWNGASTCWKAHALTDHAGTFAVDAGTVTDLRGFDNLGDVGRLDLWLWPVNAPMNQQMPNFQGLSGLLSVGTLDIDTHAEQAHQTADFLESLVEVRGKAEIWTKYWLVGTDEIETIGGNLEVEVKNTYGGADTDGLESLRYVGGHFIWDDTELDNIDALANLEYVGGDLEPPLDVTSLARFAGLQTVGGDFTLMGEVDVADLSPLTSLAFVGGRLTIESSEIQSLAGLQGVTSLGGLRIHDNAELTYVGALGNASVVGGSSVQITNNYPLTDCQANSLVSSMSVPLSTTVTVSGNVSPCMSFGIIAPESPTETLQWSSSIYTIIR